MYKHRGKSGLFRTGPVEHGGKIISLGSLPRTWECPAGVAKVETVHTFIEGLVSALTFSLFTPMSYIVTCASGGMGAIPSFSMIELAGGATPAQQQAAFEKAAEISATTGSPAYVKF